MLDHKSVRFLTLICFSALLISCSTTSNTSTTSDTSANVTNAESKYPSWYKTSRAVESDDTSYFGYATAIDSDSSASAEKAKAQAQSELKSAISNRLETIRNDAVVELGSDSGLDSPRFIIALRKAENEVPSVTSTEEIEVECLEGEGYRAFSKVSVEKESLIEELDKAFSANSRAWNAMKESEAFSQF
ncbi:hypothetical protein G3570_08420 [Balneolaceae bacterium YR4-1]|uniref:LPP20 lipoprotein n=1 Tax=Halalkalibaculum roseum TaxID=2709311 RepID=A0A6M1SZM7_9BACT|nr:hypothetical protein [Halalkalibaculum roseum]NGP76654.1 hypothetical protein [Halalkalibaculum roseum]